MSWPNDEARRAPLRPLGPEASAEDVDAAYAPNAAYAPDADPSPGPRPGEEPERAGAGDGMAEVARQRDEYLDALQRLQADFENYRKRVERQQRDVVDNAARSLVKLLLPVLDTADMSLAHGGGRT